MNDIDLAGIRQLGQRLRREPSQDVLSQLLALTADSDLRRARYAVLALASAEGDIAVEQRLHALWQSPNLKPEMQRALVKTLGSVGGIATLDLLKNSDLSTHDAELQRLHGRSLLILKRRLNRQSLDNADTGAIRGDEILPGLRVRFTCRNGLEQFLLREFTGAKRMGAGRVGMTWHAPLSDIWRARIFESFVLPLPPIDLVDGDVSAAAVKALSSPIARKILTSLTQGPIRLRLAWHGEGRQNQLIWRIAEGLNQVWPDLVNDPSASLWDAELYPRGSKLYTDLRPKALQDPRFQYRQATIPAASHPPLAAAIVQLAGIFEDEVVWDPFVGSGTELIERALAGPARSLLGTDRDAAALDAARTNIAAAGLEHKIRLSLADALAPLQTKVGAIITNPPLGRRVAHKEAAKILSEFLQNAAKVLEVGGRLVWVSPAGEEHRRLGERYGLQQTFAQVVDMGGFPATLQRFVKSAPR